MESIDIKTLEAILKETYLEVGNEDLDTKTISDTRTMTASRFRQVMLLKVKELQSTQFLTVSKEESYEGTERG